MSGGVDSSVAAYLLKEQGYDCIGCTMRLYDNADAGIPKGHTCCSLSDVEDARSVAYRLDMPYYVFDYTDAFREKVIRNFVNEYENGRTPNPCIDCNRTMKFDLLYERAKLLGCDFIATGHYARVRKEDGEYRLYQGKDPTKDQGYVLYQLTQSRLSHTLFPLGDLDKRTVRKIAAENGFLNAEKPDSQDICFVPDGDYAGAVERFAGRACPSGLFRDTEGNILGRHNGIVHYTIGQRKGLGISAGMPLYVCGLCPQTNEVILGGEADLLKSEISLTDVCMIAPAGDGELRCTVKIRYRAPEVPCTVRFSRDHTAHVVTDVPVRAVTPGQSAVFYLQDRILGGGIIAPPEQTP